MVTFVLNKHEKFDMFLTIKHHKLSINDFFSDHILEICLFLATIH